MSKTDTVLSEMIKFDTGDPMRIQHFIKVYEFAHHIAVTENISGELLEIIDVASILHDIGIHPSEEKYGDSVGVHQEELGPSYAKMLLENLGFYTGEFIDRVCFLIGHHHTYTGVDGIDYQILLEADFLVNALEDNLSREAIVTAEDKLFKTATGKDILRTMYSL